MTGTNDLGEWEASEQAWWEQHYSKITNNQHSSFSKHSSNKNYAVTPRMFERYKYLFAPLQQQGMQKKIVLEIGAGTSETVRTLLPPSEKGYRYIATDISREALRIGLSQLPGADFIQCTAAKLPFRNHTFDHIIILGVLHHIPDWQKSFDSMLDLLKVGASLVLNEAIVKPRIFGRFRKQSLTAMIDSPHEGEIRYEEWLELVQRKARITELRFQMTPLRVLLVWLFNRWINYSLPLTKLTLTLDLWFRDTFGRLIKSFGPGEILAVIEKPDIP